MKIVLFGPERRIGAWQGDKVIDLNRALANYLRDQRGETNAQAHADAQNPFATGAFHCSGQSSHRRCSARHRACDPAWRRNRRPRC